MPLGWLAPTPPQPPANCRSRRQPARAAYARFCLRPGQLVIVDEASMAATMDLDYITTAAARAGAKVLLVGDWAQLSPVQAGGAFKLLADTRRDAPALHDVRRFRHEWERAASLKLRAGRPSVAAAYVEHGRVESGSREDMIDLIFDGWLTDVPRWAGVADARRRRRDRRGPERPGAGAPRGSSATCTRMVLSDRCRHQWRGLRTTPARRGCRACWSWWTRRTRRARRRG